MPKFRKPEKYHYPLRKRADILEWLKGRRTYWGGNGYDAYPLNWDVKAHGADLSFENLVKVFEWGYLDERVRPGGKWHEGYLQHARGLYSENEQDLFDWGTEEAWRNVDDCDTNRMLWDGEGPQVKVEFGLEGRSGGHLVVRSYDGHEFGRRNADSWEDWLDEMNWKDLFYLYRMVVTWDADFTREAAEREIEYQAAFTFFVNIVGDDWIDESKVFSSAMALGV